MLPTLDSLREYGKIQMQYNVFKLSTILHSLRKVSYLRVTMIYIEKHSLEFCYCMFIQNLLLKNLIFFWSSMYSCEVFLSLKDWFYLLMDEHNFFILKFSNIFLRGSFFIEKKWKSNLVVSKWNDTILWLCSKIWISFHDRKWELEKILKLTLWGNF